MSLHIILVSHSTFLFICSGLSCLNESSMYVCAQLMTVPFRIDYSIVWYKLKEDGLFEIPRNRRRSISGKYQLQKCFEPVYIVYTLFSRLKLLHTEGWLVYINQLILIHMIHMGLQIFVPSTFLELNFISQPGKTIVESLVSRFKNGESITIF